MLEPQGPLPSSVYWRRRAVAIMGVVVLLGLGVWGMTAAMGADETVAAAPVEPTPTPRPASFAQAVQEAQAKDAQAKDAQAKDAQDDAEGGTRREAQQAQQEDQRNGRQGQASSRSGSPPGADVRPPGPAAPPASVAPCPDSAIAVNARTDKPRYAAGEKPVFSLVITNTGSTACSRDLDAARQAVAVVRTPGDGLWGSDDCSPASTDDVRTLRPGEQVVFSVRWSRLSSTPGCPKPRSAVGPGTYQLLARLDGTISEPARFTLQG